MQVCLFCNQAMESKSSKKKFCSDQCRVYFNRQQKTNGGIIYGLKNPLDDTIFYIGKTIAIKQRIAGHLHDKSESPKTDVIKNIITAGEKVVIEELEFVYEENIKELEKKLSEREKYWINQFDYDQLTNQKFKISPIAADILIWFEKHKRYINIAGVCQAVGLDKGNFIRYRKLGIIPEKYIQPLINIISMYGYKAEEEEKKIIIKIKTVKDQETPNKFVPMPVREPGENTIDFAARKNEWKAKQI